MTDDLARYILSKGEDDDDSPGALEIKFSDDHSAHLVFKFSATLISQALFVDSGERERQEYLEESWDKLLTAIRHAANATQVLANLYLLPLFGWSR